MLRLRCRDGEGSAWGETTAHLPQPSPRPLTYGSEAATLDSFASHVLQTMVDGKESKRANARDARRGAILSRDTGYRIHTVGMPQ